MATFSSHPNWNGSGPRGNGPRNDRGFSPRGQNGGFRQNRPRDGGNGWKQRGGGANFTHREAKVPEDYVTVQDTVVKILGGDSFPKCESPSLRFGKYVKFYDKSVKDGKQREITAAVRLHNNGGFRCPVFNPPGAVTPLVATLRSRLIINQAGGILENAGISIHPHFGAPFLPGSAVKGIARHAAWQEWENASGDRKKAIAEEIAETFGYPTGDAALDAALANGRKERELKRRSGSISFLAAVPCDEVGNSAKATLAVDILTPHKNDWSEPVPNAFPVVEKGTRFRFSLVPIRSLNGECHLDRARNWLAAGLVHNGMGAKTGAGYGAFTVAGVQTTPSRIYELSLVSPAFLRGADVDSEGRLRVASLRGVLRYWWRVIFGAVLPSDELERLEAKVWGGMLPDEKGKEHPFASRIALRLRDISSARPMPYDKELRWKRLHPECANPQGTSWMREAGLPYVSYGMDETKGKNEAKRRFQRKVLEAGAKWQLEVSFRNQQGLPDDVLAIHADLAIRALCTCGGIGSKSRKGFGSLDCGTLLDTNDHGVDILFEKALAPFKLKPIQDNSRPYTMATAMQETVDLPIDDPWKVLDVIGEGMKTAATLYKHRSEKGAMGLPRKIHGPLKDKLVGKQTWQTHTNPEPLRSEGSKRDAKRFASPLFVHLSPGKMGGLVVRLTGFPSDFVRDIQVSKAVLTKYFAKLGEALDAVNPAH